jgi:hypothetical protein
MVTCTGYCSITGSNERLIESILISCIPNHCPICNHLQLKFPLFINTESEQYHLTCELVSRDKDYEIFKLYLTNKPEKHILVQGNRPMLRAKGLKHKRITWKVSGDVRYPNNLEKALRLIEKHLESTDGPYKITFVDPKTDTSNRKKKGPPGPTLGKRQI